jgi:group I intron endonuclease
MGYIYIFTNKINEKSYIGQTTRPIEKRLEEHQKGKKGCRAIYSAIKKYGWGNFKIDWYDCPDEDLNFDEELLVREMGTLSPGGYNLIEGGGSSGKRSEETKQKCKEAKSGKNHPWVGRKHTEETKQKQREAHLGEKSHMFGKTHSNETKLKMGESRKGEKNYKSKRVYQYHLDGTFIASFGSSGEAGRHMGKIGAHIRACARGKLKTAYNFKWSHIKYEDFL